MKKLCAVAKSEPNCKKHKLEEAVFRQTFKQRDEPQTFRSFFSLLLLQCLVAGVHGEKTKELKTGQNMAAFNGDFN